MKLVWILRNLVKTSYSNYWHFIRIGKELLTFENCLLQEPARKKAIYKGYFNVQYAGILFRNPLVS